MKRGGRAGLAVGNFGGLVMAIEGQNYKGERERLHDFLVHADNAIVAVGIGNIDEAISEVRGELEGKGYRNITLKRIPMKEGQRIGEEDMHRGE